MVSFSQLPAVKKDTIFGAAQTKLGPSYFVRALPTQKSDNIFGCSLSPKDKKLRKDKRPDERLLP